MADPVQADRFILHELSVLQSTAREAYDTFAFNKGEVGRVASTDEMRRRTSLTSSVLQSVSTFTSSTLSAFYFDMIKDTLYCEGVDNERRKAVAATLKHVRVLIIHAGI